MTASDYSQELFHCRRQLAEIRLDVQRHKRYLDALHQISLGLIARLDKKQLLETVLAHAAALTRTDHGYVYLLEPGHDTMEIRVGMGFFSGQLGRKVKKGQGLGGRVWQTGQPVLVEDYRSWEGRIDDASLDRLRSVIGIPLKFDRRVRGVIGLGHVEAGRRFHVQDVSLLERLGALALLALEKAELYEEARRELAERRKAQARIRESEQRYRNFLESSPDPIVVYDMQGVATYVNPAFEQTFGLRREELLGKQIDFVPPEAWPATKAAIETMLKGEKISLFETQRLTKDGRKLDVQLSSTLYLDHDGKPAGNIVTLRDISARKKAERDLQSYQNHLEELVRERTAELDQINLKLTLEIEERKRAEESLRGREKELQAQSRHLEEVNTALRVLLQQRENDKRELMDNLQANVSELVVPYLSQLQKTRLNTRQQTLLRIIASNLDNIVSPFIRKLSVRHASLTPMEVRVANLVKEGKTNKEIAELLSISKNTVLFHRHNIRKKLGLTNQGINLRTHLLSFDEPE